MRLVAIAIVATLFSGCPTVIIGNGNKTTVQHNSYNTVDNNNSKNINTNNWSNTQNYAAPQPSSDSSKGRIVWFAASAIATAIGGGYTYYHNEQLGSATRLKKQYCTFVGDGGLNTGYLLAGKRCENYAMQEVEIDDRIKAGQVSVMLSALSLAFSSISFVF